LELRAGTVAVWWAGLDRMPPTTALEPELTPSERERAGRFLVEDARRRYLIGRALLRRTLSALLETAPADVPLTATDRGKPVLDGPQPRRPLAFNLSHSGDVVVVAFAPCGGLGIDLEVPGRDHDAARLARRFFTTAEADAVAAATDPEPVFLHLWTAKEAWMKAVGTGLGIAPGEVEVTPDPAVPPRILALPAGHDPAGWSLLRVPLPVPAVCTVALPAGGWRVDVREWWP